MGLRQKTTKALRELDGELWSPLRTMKSIKAQLLAQPHRRGNPSRFCAGRVPKRVGLF